MTTTVKPSNSKVSNYSLVLWLYQHLFLQSPLIFHVQIPELFIYERHYQKLRIMEITAGYELCSIILLEAKGGRGFLKPLSVDSTASTVESKVGKVKSFF